MWSEMHDINIRHIQQAQSFTAPQMMIWGESKPRVIKHTEV